MMMRGSLDMQKGRAFLAVGLVTCTLAMAVVACESDSSSNFDESEKDGGVIDTGPGFNIDRDTPGKDATGPVNCTPQMPATFSPTWKAPTRTPNACATQDLADYYDACLTNHGPDAGDPCKVWRDAHDACTKCIEPEDKSGPVQWHRDRYYYTLNVAGCLSLLRDEPNEGQCPATYSASIQCQRASCDSCFETQGATFSDFQTCQKGAKATACGTYESKIAQVCGTTYNDPDGGAYDCFQQNGDTAKSLFARVEGIFCGP
jgi:hypothetical protein